MKNVIEKLMLYNLTKQEATLYYTLHKHNCKTGYELAKLTNISRSNVYSSLASLVSKGAIYAVEEEATKYVAINVEEFCCNYIRKLEFAKEYLRENAKYQVTDDSAYITITENENVHNKIYTMLKNAKQRVYMSTSTSNLELYRQEIESLLENKLKVVLITNKEIKFKGAKIYINKDVSNQVRIIVDSIEVLTGSDDTNALYSKNRNLIEVFKDMLRNEIKLLENGEKNG